MSYGYEEPEHPVAFEDMEIEYVSQRVCYWLRQATGPRPWTEPMAYTPPEGILPGEMGAYRGVRVVELGWGTPSLRK